MDSVARPVTLLTGFLGSGKTTFLNQYLRLRSGTRFAIIENEVGQEGIDAELILRSDDQLIEMNNGCLCCTLNDNFYEILGELYQRKNDWDELIIESTGVADPAGITYPFLSNRGVRKNFSLQQVICLIDALHIEDQLQKIDEVARQVAASDIIFINKTDLVNPEKIQDLKKILQEMNPLAQLVIGNKDAFPEQEILEISNRKLAYENVFPETIHGHTHHHNNIDVLSYVFDQPFDMQKVAFHLQVYVSYQAKDIYRIKGIFYDSTIDQKMIVQSVMKGLIISEGETWPQNEFKRSRTVIIGKKLNPVGIENMLKKCLRVGKLH